MKTERRDHRNRLLREGESQCKDGRYRYTYYENGKQKAIYSWKLEAKDKLPVGKKDCVALRIQIENLLKKTVTVRKIFRKQLYGPGFSRTLYQARYLL